MPVDLLGQAAVEHNAKLVWVSVSLPPRRTLRNDLAKLGSELQAINSALVVGGRHAIEACPAKQPNVHCVQSMSKLTAFIRGTRA